MRHFLIHTGRCMGWALLSLFILLPCAGYAQEGDDHPIWWQDALEEAHREGYELIDTEQLDSILEDSRVILVDVRPDYEYKEGHLPCSVNFPFNLGDKMLLPESKKRAFEELLGPKDRPVVIYCRSFR